MVNPTGKKILEARKKNSCSQKLSQKKLLQPNILTKKIPGGEKFSEKILGAIKCHEKNSRNGKSYWEKS